MSAPLILIVEDNPPLRRVVGLTLTTAGYRVDEAADGREALEHAARELPAVVVTDLMLPDLDGEQLLVELRSLPGAEHTPVIAVSGSPGKLGLLGGEAPFTESLLKPVPPSQLLDTVERYAPLRPAGSGKVTGDRLLLVDDHPVQCKLMRLQLERLGFAVTTAADGLEALQAARDELPDVIVSDVLMPRLDGFELCRAVRADPKLRSVPVVLMSSAYVQAEDRHLAERAGATAYLERGPDLADLERALSECVGSVPSGASKPFPEFELEHSRRVRSQLEQHVVANAELGEQLELKTVELSVVAGVASVTTRLMDAADMLQEALTRCLEIGDLAAAAAWLNGASGALHRAARAGEPASAAALQRAVDEHEVEHRLESNGRICVLTPDEIGNAAVVVPLVAGGDPLGVIGVSWHTDTLSQEQIGFVRTIAGQLSEAIAVRQAIVQLDCSREETIMRLALAAEFRDNDTAQHTERVSLYSHLLASRLGLGEERAEAIRVASVMHDVGKIGVSDTILLKPHSLTPEEFEQMKLHTTFGHRILSGSRVALLELAATIALTHHERVDGTGYPVGLTGDAIPIEGRIVAVADVFDALTTPRVYRPALSVASAVEAMRAGRCRQFDPQVLDTFLGALDEVLMIRAAGTTAATAAAAGAVAVAASR